MNFFWDGKRMEFQRWDRDKLHFQGWIRDKTATCRIVSEPQNQKIHKGTTLLVFSQASVFVFERFSALQSQVSCQCVVLEQLRACRIGMARDEMGFKKKTVGCEIEEVYVGPSVNWNTNISSLSHHLILLWFSASLSLAGGPEHKLFIFERNKFKLIRVQTHGSVLYGERVSS